MDEVDYLVLGGGSAGCVVASRLSEDAGVTVGLREAGGPGDSWVVKTPLAGVLMVPTRINNWASKPCRSTALVAGADTSRVAAYSADRRRSTPWFTRAVTPPTTTIGLRSATQAGRSPTFFHISRSPSATRISPANGTAGTDPSTSPSFVPATVSTTSSCKRRARPAFRSGKISIEPSRRALAFTRLPRRMVNAAAPRAPISIHIAADDPISASNAGRACSGY